MTADRVPLAFRAQIDGRCQLQRINTRIPGQDNDAYLWAKEWLKGAAKYPPNFGQQVKTKDYQITWRFVTNSGQDEGIIRPVIGGKGHAFYPGSSMKGAFRRAFRKRFPNERDRLQHYCGSPAGDSETKPGILRFHGAYPIDDSWQKDSIVDVVHPQESWQVESNRSGGAFFMISLLRPTLKFGISSNEKLSKEKWDEIWSVWETALGYGIGSRVSAGYGQIAKHEANKILSVYLKGEGLISKRVDGSSEFRPNMFKAALRGHTLRLFGGVVDENTAQALTKKLWGGFAGRDGSIVGELGIAFDYQENCLNIKQSGRIPRYELATGQLDILAFKSTITPKRHQELTEFVTKLIQFSMIVGGFGKSWRRASHRKFYSNSSYCDNKQDIGCHWEFAGDSDKLYVLFNSPESISTYFQGLHTYIKSWITKELQRENKTFKASPTNWREAWCNSNKAQVWIRFDNDKKPVSDALDWLHLQGDQNNALKKTHLSGEMGTIGRIWQRMYPGNIKPQASQAPQRSSNSSSFAAFERPRPGMQTSVQRQYIEFLTIFPELNPQGRNQRKEAAFLGYLKNQSDFQRVW
jgi:CRISPR-associated protein Cmr6